MFLEVYPQVLGISTIKQCTKCGEYKPVDEFYKSKGAACGRSSSCKQCRIAQACEYQRNNADKVRASHARWRKENTEHYTQYHRNWRRDKPELAANASRKYAGTEKGRVAARTAKANRNAKMRVTGGRISVEDLKALEQAQTDKRGRLRCWWCGKAIKGTPHADHKIPLLVGGAHTIGNLCLTCAHCNLTKHAKTPAEFAGRLL